MTQAAAGMLKILIFLVLGMLLKKSGVLKQRDVDGIKKIILYIAIPSVLFLSFSRLDFQLSFIPVTAAIFGINFLLFWLGLFIYKLTGSRNRLIPLVICTMNFALIGIPLYEAVFGLENLHNYTMFGVGNEIFVWFVYYFLLRWFLSKGNEKIGINAAFIKSPIIWGIILGCLLGILKIDISVNSNFLVNGVYQSLNAASGLTTPLIMFFIGANISIDSKYLLPSFKLVILRFAAAFGIGYILKMLVIDRAIPSAVFSNAAFFLYVSLPAVFAVPILAADYLNEDESYIVNNTIIIHALVTIILFAVYSFIIL